MPGIPPIPSREQLVLVATALVGVPYLWWSKGDTQGSVSKDGRFHKRILPFKAFDCSGFGTWVIQYCGGLDLRWSHNTDTMWHSWPVIPEAEAQLFDAVLYGPPGDPNHVMWWIGHGRVIGASGGSRRTLEYGKDEDAKVKVVPIRYRDDLLGFRSIRHLVQEESFV